MTREEFSAIYSGNTLVISDPQEVNQTNSTSTVQVENQTLASEEMLCIQGKAIWIGAIVAAVKIAIIAAVRALSLKQLRTMSFGALRRHKERHIKLLPWYYLLGKAITGAAKGIIDYRDSTPDHQRTHGGYAYAAIKGAIWNLV